MKEGQPFRPANPTETPGPVPSGPNPTFWKSSILNWSGALAAAALIVVPLWMLLSNPAVLGGHPALPTLLVAAVALGIFWALILVRRWLFGSKQQRSGDISTWQLVRGIAGRLTVLGFVAALMWLSPFPHQPDREKTVPTTGTTAATPAGSTATEDATSITLAPAGKATTGLVFYPGARVDAHAYQDLLQPLAAAGHLVVILKVPLGVSLLDTNQARAAMDRHPEIATWAVGGHSLGGVSASSFAASNSDVAGLLLFASYPAENLTDAQGLSVLSISGSNDGLSTPDKIAASRSLLPPTTTYATVVGGVHAFFGNYGEQPGDGEPGITREQAQQQIVAESLRFMDRLRTSG
ncbi:alpha/beta hydrolase [Arthrobacter sp. ES3-54]|uniref:alpha/beta hydrolase n=1 Tax=Arthrobacter sp. ES3-54 TaxID=1502991 RepID=UPI002406DB8A|nr:alpha/beta hydrolase [Arthrobacter sp. ES3-54]MDF9752716.1 dienelactone hydrolase [Arthrobacter sp. ES3-54]